MTRDGFGPGLAQGPTDLGWAGPAQIGLGPENFGPNPSIREWVWIWPSPRPNQFGLGRAGPNRPWARKFWPKPIPTLFHFSDILSPPTSRQNCQEMRLVAQIVVSLKIVIKLISKYFRITF